MFFICNSYFNASWNSKILEILIRNKLAYVYNFFRNKTKLQ